MFLRILTDPTFHPNYLVNINQDFLILNQSPIKLDTSLSPWRSDSVFLSHWFVLILWVKTDWHSYLVFVISYLPLNLPYMWLFMIVISSRVSVYQILTSIPSKLSWAFLPRFPPIYHSHDRFGLSIGTGCGIGSCTPYLFTIGLMFGVAFETLICTCAICLKSMYMLLISKLY